MKVWTPNSSNLDLNANNGSISISAVHGQIRFHTQNGSVDLAEVGGDVGGRTTNGSLRIDLMGRSWNGHGLRAATTNGSVRLIVPEAYSAQIEASTVNGGLHVCFPSQCERRDWEDHLISARQRGSNNRNQDREWRGAHFPAGVGRRRDKTAA
jgi:DUF4097 and DUF4098 domain-containing protein YvlB